MKTWIEVSAAALQNNLTIFRGICKPSKVTPVLKANAYGHGYEQTLTALEPLQPWMIAINYPEEAKKIRELGYCGRLLVVGPTNIDDLQLIYELEAEFFLNSKQMLNAWSKSSKQPHFHIKVDTGMNRQGFSVEDLENCKPDILKNKIKIKGLASHFANVEDVLEHSFAKSQLNKFQAARGMLGKQHEAHIASSASALLLPESRFDFCRVGIGLYGLWPSQPTKLSTYKVLKNLPQLIPALSWKTRIAQVKTVNTGESIGYGCTFKTTNPTKIAILPLGYHEGYPRLAGEKHAYVSIKGRRAYIVGRVCMNMMMVNITDIENAKVGDIVTLIGKDHSEVISADAIAEWSATINYEVLSRIPATVTRKTVP